jgi:hypothetical protein
MRQNQEEVEQREQEQVEGETDESVNYLQTVVEALEIKSAPVLETITVPVSPEKSSFDEEVTEPEVEGDEEQEEYGEDYGEEEVVDPETRVGGKLFGLATPTGQKKVFSSPALSKSGQKICDKYNVHWR